MAADIYQDLKNDLQQFKDFLRDHVNTIKPAYQALVHIVPRIATLVDGLIDLLNRVKTEIQNLNVGNIPGLADVTAFTDQVRNFLQSAKTLLPDQASAIDDVLAATDVVSGLPSVDQVKGDIIGLIGDIVADLTQIKTP
jgi:hypothetical protein